MPRPARRRRRRGTIYVLVLGMTLLITVMVSGALLVSRLAGRQASAAADWEEAGVLAQSAAEVALAQVNAQVAANPSTWRSTYAANATAATAVAAGTLGRGTIRWAVQDLGNATLTANYQDPVRLYGIATVNNATRCFSVLAVPGAAPLDLLRCGLHAGGTVTVSKAVVTNTNNAQAANKLGVISTNGQIKMSGNPAVFANLEYGSVTGSTGSVTGTQTAAAAKTMPSAGVYSLYQSKATVVPWSAIASNTISNCLVSPTSTPWAGVAPNPDGVYSIAVPAGNSLQVQSVRIVGTLLISAASGGSVVLTGPISWQPARPDYPSLVLTGTNVTVTQTATTAYLSEATVGADLDGDGLQTGVFPPQFAGLFHMIGTSNSLALNTGAGGTSMYLVGTWVTDGAVTIGTQPVALVSDPTLYAHPPIGYGTGAMILVPGSWQWDAPP